MANNPVGVWNSKKGKWCNSNNEDAVASRHPEAGSIATGRDDVIKKYAAYLALAFTDGQAIPQDQRERKTTEGHSFVRYNCRQLVWDLGNTKSMASIRNTIYDWTKSAEITLVTLRAGPGRARVDPAVKKKRDAELYMQMVKDHGLDNCLSTKSD